MKKNLISVIVLALVVANLILTAILTISILPQTKKANELITKVCSAIDLDMAGGESETVKDVPIEQMVTYSVSGGEKMTINLKSDDDKLHVAILSVSLAMNNKAPGFKEFGSPEKLKEKEDMIKDKVNAIVSSHTLDDMKNNQPAIQDEIVKAIQELYGTEFIYKVVFGEVNYQ